MRKGFTLIETTISLAISSILIAVVINMLFSQVNLYKKFIGEDRFKNYSREALRFIETQIKDIQNKDVLITDNQISITKYSNEKDIIYKTAMANNKNKIVITYFKGDRKKTVSIVEDIKDFSIGKNKNSFFILIENNNGDKYEKCIGIREKEKDTQ